MNKARSESATKLRAIICLVEKGEPMDYESPTLELLGPASELIQAYMGPRYDGDAYQFSQAGTAFLPGEE
jgi:hypothetical protein